MLWAILLVGIAAGAGFAGWSPWIIAGLEFGAWVIVAVSERILSGPWTTRAAAAQQALVDAGESLMPPHSYGHRELDIELAPELEPLPLARARGDVAEEPSPAPATWAPWRRSASTPSAAAGSGTQWSVWTLEEVVRDNAPENDELAFLTVSLRDFADANGLLPAGFDPLVRESFGSLLPRAG